MSLLVVKFLPCFYRLISTAFMFNRSNPSRSSD